MTSRDLHAHVDPAAAVSSESAPRPIPAPASAAADGPPVRVVCFDLGGVIVRICRSWAEGCTAAGVDIRGVEDLADLAQVRRSVTQAYAIGAISHEEWLDRITEGTNGHYTRDEMLRIHNAWIIEEYPGLRPIVDAIHAAGVATACLSNTNEGHWRALAHVDHERRQRAGEPQFPTILALQHLHASHLLGASKPDAAIYEAFERHLEMRGAEILFFDDLEPNIAAARERGWRTVQVDHTQPSTAPQIRSALVQHGVLSPAVLRSPSAVAAEDVGAGAGGR